jgi:glycosyltransferase involved in cell wall biosynthesis
VSRARVLALVPDAWGGEGGIARFNRNLLEALASRGDLALDALGLLGRREAAAVDGVRWSVPSPGSKPGFALAALARAIRTRPSLVLCGLAGFGPLALGLARLVGARMWTLTHGVEVWQPGPRLDNLALRRADLVTAVSRCSRERLLAWSRIAPDRVRVLPNAVDLDRWRPGPRPAEFVRRYDVAERRVLLTVSRLSSAERYKGHDRVLPLLRAIDGACGPLRWIVAGRGDDLPRLEHAARELGVSDLVTFAGFVPEAELEAHYRLADAFVMPSTGEGFGIVFLEALACGCPVVAGNRDGSVDALADGALGRLVDPDRPDEIVEAVCATLRAGRSRDRPVAGVERFAIPRFRERVAALAEQVLGVPAPGPDGPGRA